MPGKGSLNEHGELGAINMLGPGGAGAAVDISVNDATIQRCKRLYIGVGGDVKVDLEGGGTGLTFKNVPSGSYLFEKVSKVYKTGTTATDIIAITYNL